MHWHLNLLAFHNRGRLALLNGTLADDFLPALLALCGGGYRVVVGQHDATANLLATATRLLGGTGGFLLLLILTVVVRGGLGVRMVLLQIAVEGGRFASVMIFLLGGGGRCYRSMTVAENDDGLTVPLLLLLLLLGVSRLLLLLLLRLGLLMVWMMVMVILFRFVLVRRCGGFLGSHIFLFDGFLPLVAVFVVQLLLHLLLMTTLLLMLASNKFILFSL